MKFNAFGATVSSLESHCNNLTELVLLIGLIQYLENTSFTVG